MALSEGSRLGPYEILSPLGAGGMGEVYRARDPRLGREVAIKVLPAEFAGDAERIARFEREARSLAALNHPNIASIYGVEDAGGTRYLVLELVPGETLAERLGAGPLSVDEALGLCRQIAEALEAAHAAGIVHRDLKPANVKITPSGKVKVLDFGLAKAFAAESGPARDLSHSPTATSGGTQRGVILGTAAYMSPEQARGKTLDRRTDVWSFGCVLYEMFAGRRAFDGETVSDVMVSVLSREPDWAALPPNLPARVRDTIRRCLRKDPDRRLHDIADARLELEDAPSELASGFPAAPTKGGALRGGRGWALVAMALVSAALGGLLTWRFVRPQAAPRTPRIGKLARITSPVGRAEWPSWSPDGNLLAYASDRGGDFEIYVRRGDGGQDVDVTNNPGQDIQPAFSPDGNSIVFVSTRSSKTGLVKIGGIATLSHATRTYGGDLWLVPSLGGPARRLAPDANFPIWRPDGRNVLYVSGPDSHRAVLEVSSEGGAPRPVLPSTESNWEIVKIGCSPDGRWVSFEDQLEAVFLMPAAGGKPVRVLSGFSHVWDGSSSRLWTLTKEPKGGTRIQCFDIDPNRAAILGTPKTVGLVTAYLRDLAVSRDGHRVVVTEEYTSRNLTRLPLAPGGGSPGGPEESLSTGRVIDNFPQVSPDSRRIAYISDTLGRAEVWILDLETRQRTRLQLPGEGTADSNPAWMPNGKEIVVARYLANGDNAGWIAALDGSRAEEFLRLTGHGVVQFRPAPGGSSLLVSDSTMGTEKLGLYDLVSRKQTTLTSPGGDKFDAEWSPDGRWIALTASDGEAVQLFRMPASGGRQIQQLTTGYERMRHPSYSPDGKWIYIQPSHRNIFRVHAEGGPLEQVTRFPEAGLFLEEPTLSPDGKYFVYCRENGGSSLWLMTLEEAVRRP
jgi:Tol biopolymer transport system component